MSSHRVHKGESVLVSWRGMWVRGVVKDHEGDFILIKIRNTPYVYAVHAGAYPDKYKRDNTVWSTGKHAKKNAKARNELMRKESKARERNAMLEEERRMMERYEPKKAQSVYNYETGQIDIILPEPEPEPVPQPRSSNPVVITCGNNLYYWVNEKPKKRSRKERRRAKQGGGASGKTDTITNEGWGEGEEQQLTPEQQLSRALFGGVLLRSVVSDSDGESDMDDAWAYGEDAADWAEDSADSGRGNWGRVTKQANKPTGPALPKKEKKKKEKKPKAQKEANEHNSTEEWATNEEGLAEQNGKEENPSDKSNDVSVDPFSYTPPASGSLWGTTSTTVSYDIQGYSFLGDSGSSSFFTMPTAPLTPDNYNFVNLATCSYSLPSDFGNTGAKTSNPYSLDITERVEEVKNFSCVPTSFSSCIEPSVSYSVNENSFVGTSIEPARDESIDTNSTAEKTVAAGSPSRDPPRNKRDRRPRQQAEASPVSVVAPPSPPQENPVEEEAEEELEGGVLFAGLFAKTPKKPQPKPRVQIIKPKQTKESKSASKPAANITVASSSPSVLVIGVEKPQKKPPLMPGEKTAKQLKREAKWEARKEKREEFKKQQRVLKKQNSKGQLVAVKLKA